MPGKAPSGIIDFNCDMGESFGAYKLGLDEQVVRFVTSVSLACGFHAGDPLWMAHTVKIAEEAGAGIGAHPAYPDLQGFGRRDMSLTAGEIRSSIKYQVGALAAFTKDRRLQHVKPHGAMYNKAVKDRDQATAIVQAIREYDAGLIHVVLAGSVWEQVARDAGVRLARECYADRAVTPQGQLVPRSQAGAVIHDEEQVVKRSLKLATQGRVTAVDGTEIDFQADTICLHGDTPGAVRLAETVRRELESAGVKIKPLSQIV